MQLTPHFRLEEFTRSQTADRFGIDNAPPAEVLDAIRDVTAPSMELCRVLLGHPVTVTSGFRCKTLNTQIKGSKGSKHIRGLAVDFVCPGYGTPREIIQRLSDCRVPYAKIIEEFGRWVHIEFHGEPADRFIYFAERSNAGVKYHRVNPDSLI